MPESWAEITETGRWPWSPKGDKPTDLASKKGA